MNAELQSPVEKNAPPEAGDNTADENPPGFWRRRLVTPIRTQLTQGVSPTALAVAVAAGVLCGIFPILGTTTVLTTLVGWLFRLNQPVMQVINWFIYPLQLILIPVYIRGGEALFADEPIPFSIPRMLEIFAESPAGFLAEFWMTLVHCVVAWLVTAPIVGAALFLSARPALRSAARRWQTASSASS